MESSEAFSWYTKCLSSLALIVNLAKPRESERRDSIKELSVSYGLVCRELS